ncbi:MAG: AMIN domain-containing protein [Leptolyngbya sp. SIO4C5]|nr:AMIN domain-containing protein [Leptolyngbya sp. SIO4C5]
MTPRLIGQRAFVFGVAIATLPLANIEPGVASLLREESLLLATVDQLSQATAPATITRVEVIPTEPGLDVVIETAEGNALEGTLSTDGNQLVIEIPDAQLAAAPSIQTEPTEGIASVEAIATITLSVAHPPSALCSAQR